ncbi:MAG: hypothetical protein MZV70_03635 [Desulfobacterales bacterium]|nr:hypothetical protein [Desulfobacterales bacterium]
MARARHDRGAATSTAPDAERCVLGIFRADEDNRVAAGERPIAPAAGRGRGASFAEALRRDRRCRSCAASCTPPCCRTSLRRRAALLARGRTLAGRAARAMPPALRAVQELCLQEALRYFPDGPGDPPVCQDLGRHRPAGGQVHAAHGQPDRAAAQGR